MLRTRNFRKKNIEKTIFAFFVNLILIVLIFISALYLGIFIHNKQTLDQELINRGRSIIESIVIARNWNARHGGVYVKKTPDMTSSPFLENPDIETLDGAVYTKKNPSLMVREISEAVGQAGSFQLHMASRKPLNPANEPDSLEKLALMAFEAGAKENFTKERHNEMTFFRYIAPLYVEASCLECHAHQGYQIGDVRGSLGVRFNIDAVEEAHTRNLLFIIGLALLSFLSLSFIIYRLVHRLNLRLKDAEARLRHMAITDELTGLKNRRYLMERLHAELKQIGRTLRPLACIMFDLDHFKRINDTYGHVIGDKILREVATTARNGCRESDILSRFGGEEFMIVLPETTLEGAREVAERLRKAIQSLQVPSEDGKTLIVTSSFGVVCLKEFTGDAKQVETALLKRVDDALYQAKERGRNCIVCLE